MADEDQSVAKQRPVAGLLARAKAIFRRSAQSSGTLDAGEAYLYNGGTSVSMMLTQGKRPARLRQAIYEKWSWMAHDPIVSTALGLLVTSALGGHETTGEIVFIDAKPDGAKAQGDDVGGDQEAPKPRRDAGDRAILDNATDRGNRRILEDIKKSLAPMFNRIAWTVTYNAAAFGDSYGRVYSAKGVGVQDVLVDELVNPILIQPYEQGNQTVGFIAFSGPKEFDRLSTIQMARMKLQRSNWVPQQSIVSKAVRMALSTDDINDLPMLPAMAGGSFLYNAEEAYDNLMSTLVGLVGQRLLDSIDEQMLGVNLESMTTEQQDRFLRSTANIFKRSKARAEEALKANRPALERIRHIVPMFNEKQVTGIQAFPSRGSDGSSSYTVEDVMFHARLLAGALGVDLSMIGFADQLAGGLGEGGFFRVSAQAAERARILRTSLTDFFNQIIDIHTFQKFGVVFPDGERPWQINFAGSISALEAEKQRTRSDAMGAGALLLQNLQTLKELGAKEADAKVYLTKLLTLDDDIAATLSKLMTAPPRDAGADGFGGGGFGGGPPFGGGPAAAEPPEARAPINVRVKKTTATESSNGGGDGSV